jgi:hypothetical protein
MHRNEILFDHTVGMGEQRRAAENRWATFTFVDSRDA